MPEALSVQLTLTLALALTLTLTRAGYARGAERAAGGRRWVRVRVRARARVRFRARVRVRVRVRVRSAVPTHGSAEMLYSSIFPVAFAIV